MFKLFKFGAQIKGKPNMKLNEFIQFTGVDK